MEPPIKKVYFIGIGGVGMSGVARVAFDQGMQVSGSDLKESRYTKQLRNAGIEVFIGHDAKHIPVADLDVVVVSTAILENNPELIEAKKRGLLIWHRAKMLSVLGIGKRTLAVSGTHGKTTSSAMLASTLDGMGCDPTFLVGGIVEAYATNAHSGCGPYYVVEADESDKSFTYLEPHAILVTNIEADHLDHYEGLGEIQLKFAEFISSLPEEGLCVVCGEDKALVGIVEGLGRRYLRYGFGEEYDICVRDYRSLGVGSRFRCRFPDRSVVSASLKQNPGRHNVLNAAGVLGLIWALGLPVRQAAASLAFYTGVRRRFELLGEVDGITVIDDYAHHPTEIAATIKAAKQLGFKRVQVLFQPHRYSRAALFTEVLKEEFAAAFDSADSVTFMDVYPAGEMPLPGVTGKTFMNTVLDHSGHPDLDYVPHRIDVVPYLLAKLEAGDMLITMGAGDVTSIGPQLLAALSGSALAIADEA
ncbi:MAG: UDP-N-acetylmuramate--L-alanine ligase [Eggerthellaceae bacterium]|nr:UDP-N-acetylmuramate--L-alanine ligase [Eggerthellaceae bacterium]